MHLWWCAERGFSQSALILSPDLFDAAYPLLAKSVCASKADFADAFDTLTHGVFRKFPWQELGVVAGGGLVAAALLCIHGKRGAALMNMPKTPCDIDLYITRDQNESREAMTPLVRRSHVLCCVSCVGA